MEAALSENDLFEAAVAAAVAGDRLALGGIATRVLVYGRTRAGVLSDANNVDCNGFSLLFRCCAQDVSLSTVRYFVEERGVPANELGRYGGSVVGAAAAYGRTDLIQYFVETAHVNPDTPNERGTTPLLFAIAHGQLGAVQYLCGTGLVDVCRNSVTFRSPIFLACYRRNIPMIGFLASVGGAVGMGLSSHVGLFIARELSGASFQHVQRLDLSGNRFCNSVAFVLARSSAMSRLHELNLADNEIGGSGVRELLLAAASRDVQLISLDLSRNPGVTDGLELLVSPETMPSFCFAGSTMRQLRLCRAPASPAPSRAALARLFAALADCSVETLDLGPCDLALHQVEAIRALARTRLVSVNSNCLLPAAAESVLIWNAAQSLGPWCKQNSVRYPREIRECLRALLVLSYSRRASVRPPRSVLPIIADWLTSGPFDWYNKHHALCE